MLRKNFLYPFFEASKLASGLNPFFNVVVAVVPGYVSCTYGSDGAVDVNAVFVVDVHNAVDVYVSVVIDVYSVVIDVHVFADKHIVFDVDDIIVINFDDVVVVDV